MNKIIILFTAGGSVGNEAIWRILKDKYELYFALTSIEFDKLLENVNPRYTFFPHWSWIVPDKIVKKYECV